MDEIQGVAGARWPTPVGGWRPRHLSYSSVSKFAECPWAWYQQYITGKKFKPNRGMVVGSLFGKAIEDAHSGKKLTDEDFERQVASLPTPDRVLLEDGDAAKVRHLFELYAPEGTPPYTGTPEWKFQIYLPDCGLGYGPVPVQILGYLDLKRPRAISEFKTSAWVDHPEWGWNQEKVDTSDQASLYWLAFLLAEGFEPEEVRYHILDTRNLAYRELVTYPTMERVLAFRDKAERLCDALDREDFGACLCGKCRVPRLPELSRVGKE